MSDLNVKTLGASRGTDKLRKKVFLKICSILEKSTKRFSFFYLLIYTYLLFVLLSIYNIIYYRLLNEDTV